MLLTVGSDVPITTDLIATIAGDVYRRQLMHDPEFVRLFDSKWDSPLQQEVINATGQLLSGFVLGSVQLFSRYLSWFSVIARGAGIKGDQLHEHLRMYRSALQHRVAPESRAQLEHLIHVGESALDTTPEAVRCCSTPQQPYTDLCQMYLAALLDGDKQMAHEVIDRYLSDQADLRGVYTHVLQPAQHELGRLWELGKVTPAEEHLGTAITQSIVSGFDRWLSHNKRVGKSFVGVCIDSEHHDMGIRFVTAFFEMDGWDTYFLGAATPRSGLIEFLKNKQPSVVGLSCSLGHHLPLLKATISEIRQQPELRTTPVIVGGYPFNADPSLVELVGADSYAPDADGAVRCAELALASISSSSTSSSSRSRLTSTSTSSSTKRESPCPA